METHRLVAGTRIGETEGDRCIFIVCLKPMTVSKRLIGNVFLAGFGVVLFVLGVALCLDTELPVRFGFVLDLLVVLVFAASVAFLCNPPGLWSQFDIVAVGDSFTQGCEVRLEDCFVSQLRNEFPRSINLGLGGGGRFTMLGCIREYGWKLRPHRANLRALELRRTRVLEIAKMLELRTIDVASAFQSHADPRSLFALRMDQHYSVEGNSCRPGNCQAVAALGYCRQQ